MLDRWLLKVQTYFLRQPKFRTWCNLEDRKYEVIEAIESSDVQFPGKLYSYISIAVRLPVNFSKVPWQDAFESFYRVSSKSSTVRKIPLTDNQDTGKADKDVWDYSGRLWYLYANIIASAYGWTQCQIAKLRVNDALAYLQEILTDRQLEKEFMWQTTEIAYPYDKGTKKSRFHPLERPYWMVKQRVLPKASSIPKSMLPMGNIVKLEKTNEAKKTKPG